MRKYLIVMVISALSLALAYYYLVYTTVSVGEMRNLPKPLKYSPTYSATCKTSYRQLADNLKSAKLQVSDLTKTDVNNNVYESEFIIRDGSKLVDIVREFDKLEAKKPQVVKLEHKDITNDYSFSLWGISYRFFKAKDTYYYGSQLFFYKEQGNMVVRKMPKKLVELLNLDKSRINVAKLFEAFKDNRVQGSIASLSGDGKTLFLISNNPVISLIKVDLTSNKAQEIFKPEKGWVIDTIRPDYQGRKLYIRIYKFDSIMSPKLEYSSFIMNLSTLKVEQLDFTVDAWWSRESDELYGLEARDDSMNLQKYELQDGLKRTQTIKTYEGRFIQYQGMPDDENVFLAENKGEMGVTLFRINIKTRSVTYTKKISRFPTLNSKFIVLSPTGEHYFSFNEKTEQTFITDLNANSVKKVFNDMQDIRAIEWLPDGTKALFLIGDLNLKGSGPANLKLYDVKSNSFKDIEGLKLDSHKILLSPDCKNLYYTLDGYPSGNESYKITGILK